MSGADAHEPESIHVDGPVIQSPRSVLRSGPVQAALVVTALGFALEFSPNGVGGYHLFRQPAVVEEKAATSPADRPPELELGEAELEANSEALPNMAAPSGDDASPTAPRKGLFGGQKEADLTPPEAAAPPVPLLDPTGKSLDHFFAALERTQRKEPGAVTRIAHFGDSIVVSDYVSGTLRRKFQETFGDAGHGYMLIANPWPAYFHNDVFRFATSGFRVSRIVGPLTNDGLYGLGGVTFRGGPGIVAQFGTAEKGDYGTHVSRFVLSYLESPGAGKLLLDVDGERQAEIDTNGPASVVRRHELTLPDGPHRFEMKAKDGDTRTFGVVLERDGPGVVLDALGVQGARIRFLDKQDDAHFADELRWRKPDLVVFQFGANESGDGYAYPMDEYQKTMSAVIEQAQKALPNASCLILGAMDRARVENGQVTSMKIIQLIVAEQKRAAEKLGCAYFDTYESMGGWGSMPAWVKRGLGQADMTHPTGVGAERLATWIYGALLGRYDAYLRAPH